MCKVSLSLYDKLSPMKILTVDVGTGTQDIFLYNSQIDIENGQICDGYNRKSLMGNWYEERWAPKQPFRKDFEQGGAARPYETDVAYATKKGELKGLPRCNRQPKWDTTGVIPDD